jgi:hypothetical protein
MSAQSPHLRGNTGTTTPTHHHQVTPPGEVCPIPNPGEYPFPEQRFEKFPQKTKKFEKFA